METENFTGNYPGKCVHVWWSTSTGDVCKDCDARCVRDAEGRIVEFESAESAAVKRP